MTTLDTRTLVQGAAQITRIVTLRKGDVYKRLETAGRTKLVFGIVTDVMHNGDAAAITAVEYDGDYFGAAVSRVVFSSADTPAIFAADPAEFVGQLGDLIVNQRRKITQSETELGKQRDVLADLERASTLDLTAAATDNGVPVEVQS